MELKYFQDHHLKHSDKALERIDSFQESLDNKYYKAHYYKSDHINIFQSLLSFFLRYLAIK